MKDYSEAITRVRYAETDQMGVVHHGNYFTWFEIGRVELCRELGFEYKQMETEDDSFIVVAEAHCRYKRPARFDDVLEIRTRVTQSQRRTLRFGYEIFNQATRRAHRHGRNPARNLRQPRPAEIPAGKISPVFSGVKWECGRRRV